jgi:hypothetical protein
MEDFARRASNPCQAGLRSRPVQRRDTWNGQVGYREPRPIMRTSTDDRKNTFKGRNILPIRATFLSCRINGRLVALQDIIKVM